MGTSYAESWPELGYALAAELQNHPGRLCLALGGLGTASPMLDLLASPGVSVTDVGAVMTSGAPPKTEEEVRSRLRDATVLTDLEILFWRPLFNLDVVRLLAWLARSRPIIAVWPGQIDGRRAFYSRPGRRDYFEGRLSDVVVLRPRRTRFPDEMPFDLERIPA